MQQHQEILNTLRTIIQEVIDIAPNNITPEANLADDLRIDSLARVEVVMALEDAFRIEFTEAQANTLFTVGDLIDAIETGRNEMALVSK